MKSLKKWFKQWMMTPEERYLCESSDVVDLENRQRLIARGQAPYQVSTRNVLFGQKYQ